MLAEKISQVLDFLKSERGIKTQGEFALSVGMPLDRVKNMVTGRVKRITTDEARVIEATHGIRTHWWTNDNAPMLLTDAERRARPVMSELAEVTKEVLDLGLGEDQSRALQEVLFGVRRKDTDALNRLLSQVASVSDGYVQVPRYDVRGSAGNGAVIHDEAIVDHLAFRRDWIVQAVGCDPAHMALIEVRGDSMAPTISNGDLVLLDTRPTRRRIEGVYAINLHDSLLIKRIRVRLSGVVEVVSDNPQYGSETISGDELGRLLIIGRVVWHGKKF